MAGPAFWDAGSIESTSSDQGGDQQPLSCVALLVEYNLALHQIELQVTGSTACDCFARS
jgi:hypothetical protein